MDTASELDAVFFALSDRTRRSLLSRLLASEATAGVLADGFDVSRPAISQHLRVLRYAELVVEERRGRERVYTLVPQKLQIIGEWLDAYRVFWPARLHDLKNFVESMPDEPTPNPKEEAMTLEIDATFTLPAAVNRVFQALTDERELRVWFASEVHVEAKTGGAYQFWGSATLGNPKEADASQVLTEFTPDTSLAYGWKIHGQPSEVSYQLTAGDEPNTTKLTVHHVVKGTLPFRTPKHVIDDLWKLNFANLKEHLAGRTGSVVLADFETGKPEVRASIEIAAPPSKVFRALLEPELMNKWLYASASVDVKKGAISYGWKYDVDGIPVLGGPTKILERIENQKLVTDWPDWRGDGNKPSTKVTWTLEALDGGKRTRVTLVHDGFEHMVDRSDYLSGWGGFLDNLAEVVLALP